jgi:cobalt-zinc-cadmium efflux system protein
MKESLLKKALLVSSLILLIEIIFGIISNSLALLSDALHVSTDIFSALIALFAIKISKKACDEKFSLGYHRFEVMASFMNGLLLLVVVGLIFMEALNRFARGVEVSAYYMLPAAILGFAGDLYVIKLLYGNQYDINIRGVYLHALSNTLSSIAVIACGVAIVLTGYSLFDPAISILIGAFVLLNALKLVKDSSLLLLHGTPPDLNLDEIKSFILSFPGVLDVHSLHIYALCSNVRVMDAHVVVGDMKLSEVGIIRGNIVKGLVDKFGLTVTSLQFECER